MRVLKVTNMYPTADQPHFGIFVRNEVESLRRLGVDIDVLFVNGRASRLNYLAGFARLWKRLRERQYDLIHAHYIFAGLIARAQTRYPVVLTHHGAQVFRTWQAPVCRFFTPWFDAVIVRTEEMKTKLGVKDACVISAGIDLETFRPLPRAAYRSELRLPADKRLVLWAGEPRPEKRFDLVVQAMERLRQHRPDVELVVLSGKPQSFVPQYMNACDVLVLTSAAEGSPNVVKEAMACNLPVVATAVGDVPDLISETQGCYVCSKDPADIADRVAAALDFGRRTDGRSRIQHLSQERIAERIVGVYREVLSSRAASGQARS